MTQCALAKSQTQVTGNGMSYFDLKAVFRSIGFIVIVGVAAPSCSQETFIPEATTVDSFIESPPSNQRIILSLGGQITADQENYYVTGEQHSIIFDFELDDCVSELVSKNVSIVFVPENSYDAETRSLKSYISIDYVEFDDPEDFIICRGEQIQ